MKCKDCELEKCVHTFNANNVDKCERIKEVRKTINRYEVKKTSENYIVVERI